jgi:hypothetical protein
LKYFGLAAMPTVKGQLATHMSHPCYWSDGMLHTAIRKMFPAEWLEGLPLPPFEDIINGNEMSAWREYVYLEGLEDPALAPHKYCKGYQSLTEGRQRGAVGSKGAIDPLVGYGGTDQAHFDVAISKVSAGDQPWETGASVSQDLRYAAVRTVSHAKGIRQLR